jgi:Type I restriction enzyme R protein N terminus (HSDR_N)
MTINLSNLGSAKLLTESDVEQKLILPLLTANEWLGIPEGAIYTKKYLPPATIDKGRNRRIGYFPDYSVWIDGLPILIIEAKSPLESVEEGFREAQLYAHELNKGFPTGVSPARFVACSNGTTLQFGYWDSNSVETVEVRDLRLASAARNVVRTMLSFENLTTSAERTRRQFSPTQAFRPIDSIGGDATLNRRIQMNSFATDIAPLVRMFFVSESAERIEDIIEKAYVASDETTKYDQILELFLKDNIRTVQDPAAKEITTTQASEDLLTPELRSFRQKMPSTGQIQLLLGPVGAGKSLFCQRYYRYLATGDVRDGTYWTFIDFNQAPEDLANLETWLCKAFIESFERENCNIDLYKPETLRRVFAPDINKLRQIYRSALGDESKELELRIADSLAQWTQDSQKFSREICRFLNGDCRKVVVVIFDNVDRLERDDQIRIFQVAQWFRSQTRSFCLLAIRDETYEQFKNKPPLDAFINAVHFAITPPRFIDVVRKRLELCIDYIAQSAPKRLSYALPDGKRIVYPATKLGEFLKTLYFDIFRSGRRISWLLEALAGRDVRSSLEMFTRILMSGHLDERQITGTVLGSVRFSIRDSTIVNVLMKTDYLYFDNSHGFITNVLYCGPYWKRQSNFLVFEALEYLVGRRKLKSEFGSQGYFSVAQVIGHLNRLSFAPDDAQNALTYLLRRNLIVADHMGKKSLKETDYVRAHASGFVHARLLVSNIHYISGIAPVTYLNDRKNAEQIGRLSAINTGFADTQFTRKKDIVFLLLQYMKEEYSRHCEESPLFDQHASGSRYLLRMIESSLDIRAISFGSHVEPSLFDQG